MAADYPAAAAGTPPVAGGAAMRPRHTGKSLPRH